MTAQQSSSSDLRAVLFDSGGVLMRPIGGRWNPRADFERTVLAHEPSVAPERFATAIAAGEDFFAASSSTPDYDDHHRVMLRRLGVEPTSRLLADLRRDAPPAAYLETYPDVEETLEELSRRDVRCAAAQRSRRCPPSRCPPSPAWPELLGLF